MFLCVFMHGGTHGAAHGPGLRGVWDLVGSAQYVGLAGRALGLDF